MPGFDGTGPLGQGPMTGGGFGYCVGSWPYRGRTLARGVGRGGRPWGGGRGFAYGGGWRRAGYYRGPYYGANYPLDPVRPAGSETEFLKAQADDLRAELQAVEQRLADLEKNSSEE